jgi:IS5 family transposase
VDVETLYLTDIHPTTAKKYEAKICPQVARRNVVDLRSLAAGPRYDAKAFRDELRENSTRPLIKPRILNSRDHAHNSRMDVIAITNAPCLKLPSSVKCCWKPPSTTFAGASDTCKIRHRISKLLR